MRKILLLFVATGLICLSSCKNNKASKRVRIQDSSAQAAQDGKYPAIHFEESKFDFGEVDQGKVVEHDFTFTNSGEASLTIISADPSCGCTVPTWTTGQIKPGEEGTLKVKFDSKGKKGEVKNTVRLKTNTEKGNEILTFTANVKKK